MQDKRAAEVLSRYDLLKSDRSVWENHWRDVATFVLPRKEHIAGEYLNAGEKKGQQVYDATAIHANELLASALHSMLTNPSTQWFGLSIGDDTIDNLPDVRKYFEECTRIMHNVLNYSNFQTEVHETYLDLGSIGTTTLRIEEDDMLHVRFFAEPITEVTVDENSKGIVDVTFREFSWTFRQIVQEWGIEVLTEEQKRMYTAKPDDKLVIIHAIMPYSAEELKKNKGGLKGKKYASLYLDKQGKRILNEKGFNEFPTVVPRWTKVSGELYGRSPAMKALPDIKMLNSMKKTTIRSAQKQVDPPIQAPDDGMTLPLKLSPNAVNYYRAGTTSRIEPILSGGRIDFGYQAMQDQRTAIREAFFIDQLQLNDGPQMTATEVQQRTEEKLRLLGPILGRQHHEFLKPLVERVYSVLNRKGLLPEPPQTLEKKRLQVQYISMIARAQKAIDAQTISRTVQSVLGLVESNPDMLDNFDTDKVLRHNARLLGVPENLMVSEEKVEEVRKGRAELQQQQYEMQNQSANADIALKQKQAEGI